MLPLCQHQFPLHIPKVCGAPFIAGFQENALNMADMYLWNEYLKFKSIYSWAFKIKYKCLLLRGDEAKLSFGTLD